MVYNTLEFKYACKEFLAGFGLNALRSYAREIGVSKPTKDKKKDVLIDAIVAVLVGEILPQAPSLLGAPVKNDFVDPKIPEGIKRLHMISAANAVNDDGYGYKNAVQQIKENPRVLSVADPNAEALKNKSVEELYRGQLETLNNVPMILPLNCTDSEKKVVISVEKIRAYDLREGDLITCYAEKRNNILVATTILTINDYVVDTFKRTDFDNGAVCYPKKKITFYNDGKGSLSGKFLQWLFPVGRGQRGLILAPPKTGKTKLLADIYTTATMHNPDMYVFTLLVDQAPESVANFRKMYGNENLLYTTYEEDAERQVFVAEFILKRAKRLVECGRDVLLLVDSLNSLSRAYNDTPASAGGKVLAGGLESKTLQYIKRYFGTARCFENGGSLTILGTLCTDTGNPADDLLKSELTSIANQEIHLSDDLAKECLYPAFDLSKIRQKSDSSFTTAEEEKFAKLIRTQYLSTFGWEGVLELFQGCDQLRGLGTKAIEKLKEYHQ